MSATPGDEFGIPAPVLWGEEATVRERLREGIADLKFALRMYHFDYPFPPNGVVEFFRANYGPMTRAFASLDTRSEEKLRNEIVALWSAHNYSGGQGTQVDAEYLEVIATRAGNISNAPRMAVAEKSEESMGRRSGLLADRIEEGAAKLAAFAEGISEAEWRVPVKESGKNGRPVGVIVHHVANMYPIEIDVARAVAAGKAVMDVTWEAVAQLNAKHAQEHSGVTKAAALELLRRNSHDAAAAVRTFTDEELDRAAPFSLSFGAPVTAQFVIEDHALRHSWHHLSRIRAALGR
jgi:hypothetical protein